VMFGDTPIKSSLSSFMSPIKAPNTRLIIGCCYSSQGWFGLSFVPFTSKSHFRWPGSDLSTQGTEEHSPHDSHLSNASQTMYCVDRSKHSVR
jgi:hypothetical protein